MAKRNNKREGDEKQAQDSHMELDVDFNQYLREISKAFENEVNDDEGKQLMINNFIEAIPEGKEEAVARNGLGSKILERLIGFSSVDNFEKFTGSLQSADQNLFSDKKATYVLETCLKIATVRTLSKSGEGSEDVVVEEEKEPAGKRRKFVKKSTDIEYNSSRDIKPDHKNYCKAFVSRISMLVMDNIENLVKSSQGTHLVRTCLLSLAGIVTSKSSPDERGPPVQINLKTEYSAVIDDEWIEFVCDCSKKILQWPHFAELAFEERTSQVLQVLIQALFSLEKHDSLKKLIKSILKKCFQTDEDGDGDEEKPEEEEEAGIGKIEKMKPFTCKSSQFLLEAVMQYCEEKQFNKIYSRYFKSHLLTMCDSNVNFTVQRLIDFTKSKEMFEEIFNQITPVLSKLLQNGRTGVVLALCKACDRLSYKQGQFIQSLLKALECERSQSHIIQCIVALMPLQVVEKKTDIEVHLHGSLILQHILHFNKPIKIVQNLLDMKPQNLSDIFCHPKGSRVADAYIESKFIGEKSREKLVKHLEGMYLKMALSRNGSHVLEKLYQLSGEGQKEVIVKELSERTNQLGSTPSGKIVAYKFNVDAYARNPNQWRSFIARSTQ